MTATVASLAASHRPSSDRARLEANAHLGPRYWQVVRAWNPDDPRILTPKTFGWGLGVNSIGCCTRCACSCSPPLPLIPSASFRRPPAWPGNTALSGT